jgi:RimJ/RimL family protein N-acetyltransferase
MLKIRELHEVPALFELMVDPEVFPYVRQKANSVDEFYFLTKQTIEAEENRELISRTILDEYEQPIGTINLFDIEENYGFLATWIGKPYFGKGYNRLAKDAFFDELFHHHEIEGIFMKVRKTNIRSMRAVRKLPFITLANETFPEVFRAINPEEELYDLFLISKDNYLSFQTFSSDNSEATDEEVS